MIRNRKNGITSGIWDLESEFYDQKQKKWYYFWILDLIGNLLFCTSIMQLMHPFLFLILASLLTAPLGLQSASPFAMVVIQGERVAPSRKLSSTTLLSPCPSL